MLAARRTDASAASPYTLSPASLLAIPAGVTLVLPSPNGSAICASLAGVEAAVLAGCLRNAGAVARAAAERGARVGVVAAGEWRRGGGLRLALEDLVGAGLLLGRLRGRPSADALGAIAAASAVATVTLADTVSARELIRLGFARDVELALDVDASDAVPVLDGGGFRRGG